MIITKEVKIKINPRQLKYYLDLGYNVFVGGIFNIKVIDIQEGSTIKYSVICNNCNITFDVNNKSFKRGNGVLPKDCDIILCKKCKTKNTCISKYGVDNPIKNEEVWNKLKSTCNNRYGSDTPLENKKILNKIKITNLKKYGVDIPSKNPLVIEKISKSNIEKWNIDGDNILSLRKITNLNKYGVDSPIKNIEILNKIKKTNLEKYGVENVFSSDEIRSKIKATNIIKYGVDHPSKNDIVKEKRKKTFNNRYGVDVYSQTKDFKNIKFNKDIEIAKNIFDKYDCNIMSYNDKVYSLYNKKCKHIFETTSYLFYQRVNKNINFCTVCFPINSCDSFDEIKLYDYIKSLGVDVKKNDRDIISPKELDIYLPEYKLAIEYNGLYWHSDLFKDKKYHIDKTLLCNNKGINLIHIWEDEWIEKPDIIKSILHNKLNLIKESIAARKCIVKEISNKDALNFYNDNHIQGGVNSQYNLGLFFNNELLSLMSFANRKINSKLEFELTRFCNKKFTIVNGAASKLFKYFIRNFEFTVISSYSDISIFSGKLYEKLGFLEVDSNYLNYWWCKGNKKYHRFTFNKKRLISEGFDPNKTESEIMRDRGFYKLYGCGHKKWIYKKTH